MSMHIWNSCDKTLSHGQAAISKLLLPPNSGIPELKPTVINKKASSLFLETSSMKCCKKFIWQTAVSWSHFKRAWVTPRILYYILLWDLRSANNKLTKLHGVLQHQDWVSEVLHWSDTSCWSPCQTGIQVSYLGHQGTACLCTEQESRLLAANETVSGKSRCARRITAAKGRFCTRASSTRLIRHASTVETS